MTTLYKAVRPDGSSFYDPDFRWLRRDGKPYARPVVHPAEGGLGYLSASVAESDCTGFQWPCRLLTVEPVGETWAPGGNLPNKRAARAFRVTGEVEPWRAFGPNGEAVAALIERAGRITPAEARDLVAAWGAAWGAARDAARDAAGGVAGALVVRDLILPEQYQTLVGPWECVMGPVSS